MNQYSLMTGLFLASALGALVLAMLGWPRRALPGARGVVLVACALVVWSASNAVQTAATATIVKRTTLSVTYTAIVVFTLGVWWGMTELAGRPRMSVRDWVFLAAPAPVTVALVWTGYGNLLFAEILIPNGHGPVDNVAGPWYVVLILWAYSLILVGLVLFSVTVLKTPGPQRRQAVLMVGIVIVPLAINALVTSRVAAFGGYDPTPIALLFTVGGLALGIRHMGLLDAQFGVRAVARDVVVEAMQDGVVVVDGRGNIIDLNPAAVALLGISAAEAVGTAATMTIPGWPPGASGSWEVRNGDESAARTLQFTASTIGGGHRTGPCVVMLRDITITQRKEDALRESARVSHHQLRHDPLTGLGNRTLLFETLRETLERLGDAPTSLLILDLDGFKSLNDTFGHRAGDDALQALAMRLTRAAGQDAVATRLAGDEFAVVIPGQGAEGAMRIATRIQAALRLPFVIDGQNVSLGGSIGAAVAPEHGDSADELVHAADVAMYHAKRDGAGVATYDLATDARRPERLRLRSELRSALTNGQIVTHYQPQCDRQGRLVGWEALVRWKHPDRGLLSPHEFLPLLESSEQMCELTDVVLDRVLRDARRWRPGDLGTRIAVNLSARDLQDPGLTARLLRRVRESEIPPGAITLEVTENAMASAHDAIRRLERLREEGLRIALDDFGTGFAPLTTLRDLPVDELKIDRTFVDGMLLDERRDALVQGLVRLGHDLGLTVVAEGIEHRETLDALVAAGCDVFQGFLLGVPAPPARRRFVRTTHFNRYRQPV